MGDFSRFDIGATLHVDCRVSDALLCTHSTPPCLFVLDSVFLSFAALLGAFLRSGGAPQKAQDEGDATAQAEQQQEPVPATQ